MKHIIGIADMRVSSHKGDTLITYSLGSCLGISAYDPFAKVGGLLHVMLPLASSGGPHRDNPLMYVDTGVPQFLDTCFKAGARKNNLIIKVAGGAFMRLGKSDDIFFQIGKRNYLVLRKLLWKNGLLMKNRDIGGNNPRTMALHIGTGQVSIKCRGVETVL